jgi:hypothetical protein
VLALPSGIVAAAGVKFEGSCGERDYRPAGVAAPPAAGFKISASMPDRPARLHRAGRTTKLRCTSAWASDRARAETSGPPRAAPVVNVLGHQQPNFDLTTASAAPPAARRGWNRRRRRDKAPSGRHNPIGPLAARARLPARPASTATTATAPLTNRAAARGRQASAGRHPRAGRRAGHGRAGAAAPARPCLGPPPRLRLAGPALLAAVGTSIASGLAGSRR